MQWKAGLVFSLAAGSSYQFIRWLLAMWKVEPSLDVWYNYCFHTYSLHVITASMCNANSLGQPSITHHWVLRNIYTIQVYHCMIYILLLRVKQNIKCMIVSTLYTPLIIHILIYMARQWWLLLHNSCLISTFMLGYDSQSLCLSYSSYESGLDTPIM